MLAGACRRKGKKMQLDVEAQFYPMSEEKIKKKLNCQFFFLLDPIPSNRRTRQP